MFTRPFVGGEDYGEEAVGGFDAPGAVDDVDDLDGCGLHGEAGLLVQLAACSLRNWSVQFALADGEVPHTLGELGVFAALEQGDVVGGHVVDDDCCDQQGHRFECWLEGLQLVVDLLGHGVPFEGRIAGMGYGFGRTGLGGEAAAEVVAMGRGGPDRVHLGLLSRPLPVE